MELRVCASSGAIKSLSDKPIQTSRDGRSAIAPSWLSGWAATTAGGTLRIRAAGDGGQSVAAVVSDGDVDTMVVVDGMWLGYAAGQRSVHGFPDCAVSIARSTPADHPMDEVVRLRTHTSSR